MRYYDIDMQSKHQDFSKNLKNFRKSLKLNQSEFASRLNLTQTNISDWETGRSRPTLDAFVKLCLIYDVSPDELLDF